MKAATKMFGVAVMATKPEFTEADSKSYRNRHNACFDLEQRSDTANKPVVDDAVDAKKENKAFRLGNSDIESANFHGQDRNLNLECLMFYHGLSAATFAEKIPSIPLANVMSCGTLQWICKCIVLL